MRKTLAVLMLAAITIFAACSKKSNAGKTAKVIPTTFNVDISPLVQAKCTPCHIASKGGRKGDFENYESAKRYAAEMMDRVVLNPGQRGFMPQKHEKLAEAEIALIKKWIDGGLLEK
ncbi:MAG: hypothetical protein ABI685_10890 [Ferruginibacter sp.]